MANRKNTFLIKRSNIAGKVPSAGDLLLGELAINTSDVILYASGTTANSIVQIGWDRVARTGDTMTGTLFTPYLSATTISATTYINLPTDIYTTGGTYTTGTTIFTNNTGGTFSVSGFNTSVSPISVVNLSSLFSTGLASTGVGASGVTYSNFFGRFAGRSATNANNSNFMGNAAGYSAIGANNSNFLGFQAGQYGTNANNSNFFGFSAGDGATNAWNSNFMGSEAGNGAISANDSNFFGFNAGYQASLANNSNFFGSSAGWAAAAANNSNFLGQNAGYLADTADYSNFIGSAAGYAASNAHHSNFIGNNAGSQASQAFRSNFIGVDTGANASNAQYSNFLGSNAGNQAINASYSNFIGFQAGQNATGSSYSTLIGYKVGYAASYINSIGSNNIIIGNNISLSAGTTNAINIGGILFGTNTYSATAGNPIISATTGGRIGIGVVNPLATLHVSGNTLINGGLTATTISATTYFGLPTDIRTTGVTVSSGSVAFNRNDSMSAYSVSFSGVNISVISDDTNKRITFSASTGGSSLPILNQAQIFIGDTLNVAQSRGVSGDISLNFSGLTTIQPNVVTYSKMQTVSTNALLGSQSVSGGTVEEIPFIDAYITTGVAYTLLTTTTNWDIDGVYIGTSITGTYQGQSCYDGRYWFTAVDDNLWIRLIRG